MLCASRANHHRPHWTSSYCFFANTALSDSNIGAAAASETRVFSHYILGRLAERVKFVQPIQ